MVIRSVRVPLRKRSCACVFQRYVDILSDLISESSRFYKNLNFLFINYRALRNRTDVQTKFGNSIGIELYINKLLNILQLWIYFTQREFYLFIWGVTFFVTFSYPENCSKNIIPYGKYWMCWYEEINWLIQKITTF